MHRVTRSLYFFSEIDNRNVQMEEMFGRFYKKVWSLPHRKGANFTEETPEITRKFGRHVLTDRKVFADLR